MRLGTFCSQPRSRGGTGAPRGSIAEVMAQVRTYAYGWIPACAYGWIPAWYEPGSREAEMTTVSSERMAAIFVEVADTLVDDFDLIEFLYMLTDRVADLVGAAAVGLVMSDQRGGLEFMARLRRERQACGTVSTADSAGSLSAGVPHRPDCDQRGSRRGDSAVAAFRAAGRSRRFSVRARVPAASTQSGDWRNERLR